MLAVLIKIQKRVSAHKSLREVEASNGCDVVQIPGVIRGYLIHFSHASSRNETQVMKVIGSRPLNEYILSDLSKYRRSFNFRGFAVS